MWKSLVFILECTKEEEKGILKLKEVFEKQGIDVRVYGKERGWKLLQGDSLQQFFFVGEMVLVTNDSMIGRKALLRGIAVLGYEREGEFLSGISYITQSLEELSVSYVKRVYCRFHDLPVQIQETQRLWIREMIEEDAEEFFRMQREEDISQVMERRRRCVEEERAFIKEYRKNQYAFYEFGFFSIIEKETGKLIGKVGVEEHNREGKNDLELGYWIEKNKRRMGYAYEAGDAVLKFLKEELEFSGEICCFVQPENMASLKTAQKLGFLKTEQIADKCYRCVCML